MAEKRKGKSKKIKAKTMDKIINKVEIKVDFKIPYLTPNVIFPTVLSPSISGSVVFMYTAPTARA